MKHEIANYARKIVNKINLTAYRDGTIFVGRGGKKIFE